MKETDVPPITWAMYFWPEEPTQRLWLGLMALISPSPEVMATMTHTSPSSTPTAFGSGERFMAEPATTEDMPARQTAITMFTSQEARFPARVLEQPEATSNTGLVRTMHSS